MMKTMEKVNAGERGRGRGRGGGGKKEREAGFLRPGGTFCLLLVKCPLSPMVSLSWLLVPLCVNTCSVVRMAEVRDCRL